MDPAQRRPFGHMLLATALLGAALWLVGVRGRTWVSASDGPEPTGQATEIVALATHAAHLPHAWHTKTARPVPSATATPSASPDSSAGPEPTSTPVPPTPVLSPTPTRTPLHRPTDKDPTWIQIPSIGLDVKVVTVGIELVNDGMGGTKSVWQVADYAAGFHQGTARVGHAGNTVITGHNNIRGEVFRDLHKLEPGDDVFLWVDDWPFRYRVGASYRLPIAGAPSDVLEDNLKWIMPTDDQRLTLVTCWPPWSNTHRTVVVAFPAAWDD